ncbi:helix-turn-helix domain-containing protein [Dactylosporangium sp. AC04546]|uniref:TetR/AcrR family transcriptional regulator n=1 Tax=Dactylosporangium sp. AC04546 TaxID=2862460 RepID=UPI001EDF89EF|nr:TetR/AcrR family transcriptional regulator [Dactylosporangium sp. AC04546]WVK81546.1 helix-turn-helix domain-containing protein [Dactylosporangium sp. AC04546]
MLYGARTPQRRDAQRNRAAIVEAASELMMTRPDAIPMPAIARRAGVGQATLYRHFPDRSALADAVVDHQLDRLEQAVTDDFRHLLGEVLRTQVAMRPLVALVRRFDQATRERYLRRVVAALAGPLRRAQAGGRVRADLVPGDLMLLFTMLADVTEQHAERSIALLLDGVFTPDGALTPDGGGSTVAA